jgi:hypothetical protein
MTAFILLRDYSTLRHVCQLCDAQNANIVIILNAYCAGANAAVQ